VLAGQQYHVASQERSLSMPDRPCLHALVGQGVGSATTSQTLGDSGMPSTRRSTKMARFDVAETDRLARVIERDFEFLPDSRDVTTAGGCCRASISGVRSMTPWRTCMSMASRSC